MGLEESFWQQESSAFTKRLLLDAAEGRETGSAGISFNIFDVEMNFDEDTATVFDVLEAGRQETVGLESFLARARAIREDALDHPEGLPTGSVTVDPRRSSGWPPTAREWKFLLFSLALMALGLVLLFLIVLGTAV